jgi:hypothetical protein
MFHSATIPYVLTYYKVLTFEIMFFLVYGKGYGSCEVQRITTIREDGPLEHLVNKRFP